MLFIATGWRPLVWLGKYCSSFATDVLLGLLQKAAWMGLPERPSQVTAFKYLMFLFERQDPWKGGVRRLREGADGMGSEAESCVRPMISTSQEWKSLDALAAENMILFCTLSTRFLPTHCNNTQSSLQSGGLCVCWKIGHQTGREQGIDTCFFHH